MVECPECLSQNLDAKEDKPVDDEDWFCITVFYKCLECGCEFEITEESKRTTEISKHGSEYDPEFEEFEE